jgi:tetratricopeptide (TPR) repeat protein
MAKRVIRGAVGPGPGADRGLVPGLLVVAAALLAYLPALSGEFIWNDSDYVTAPALRSLRGLAAIWTHVGATQQYYPLLHSAFWVQHRLWGDHPFGYHALTLLLHAAAAVLFALVLRRLGGEALAKSRFRGFEWVAALLFALHPVHVESVAWISEQKNTLSLVFYLGAALAYLRFDGERGAAAYAAALALFVLSLLCKTVTASLPAALLVALWWKRGRLGWRRDLLPLVPWLVLGAAAGRVSSWVEQAFGGARGPEFDLPFASRVLVAGRAVWFYLGNLAWPHALDFVYPRWTIDPSSAGQWLFPLGVALVVVALWALRQRTRAPLAAFLFFVGSLFPVLGFVNLYGARYSWVWDHWQYLPDLGLLALAAAGLTAGWRLAAERLPVLGAGGARWGALAALSLLLGALSWSHCGMFHDDDTLYRENLALNPGSWLALNNLGIKLELTPGRLGDAVAKYEEALRLNPGFAEGHNNLGNALAKTPGRSGEAVAQYEEAIRLKPDFVDAHYDLGNVLNTLGRKDEAMAQFEAALRINPGYVEAHYNLGNTLDSLGRSQEAVAQFEAALTLRPDNAAAHNNLGLALAKIPGRMGDAVAEYEAALRLNPDLAETHANLGLALSTIPARQGEVVAQYEAALRLNPGYAYAHFYLANFLVQAGRIPEAIGHYQEALRLQPGLVEADNNLGMVLCRTGHVSEGMAYVDEAIRLKPDYAQAHFTRGAALMQSGRRDEAVAEFEKVLQLRPGDPTVLRILGMIRGSP